MIKKREKSLEDREDKRKKQLDKKEYSILANTEHEIYADVWTKSYLKSIGSSGVIHSIHTGKHAKFIMCNVRNEQSSYSGKLHIPESLAPPN